MIIRFFTKQIRKPGLKWLTLELAGKQSSVSAEKHYPHTMNKALILVTCILIFGCDQNEKAKDQLQLEGKLSGKWIAEAFDGELHEEWNLNENGWMQQQGYYIEKNDTSYAAQTQIQKAGNEIILFSVIKNSNPKIFKSIQTEENKIIFENSDYKNPYQVKYEFISDSVYRRTIKGYENDSLVIYEFKFKKSI